MSLKLFLNKWKADENAAESTNDNEDVNLNEVNNVKFVNQENNIITCSDNYDSISDNADGNNTTRYQIEPVASSSKQNFYTPRTKRRMSQKICTLMNKKAISIKNTKEVYEPQLKNKLPNKNDKGSLNTRRKRKNIIRPSILNLNREGTAESSTMNASYNSEFFSDSSYISEFVDGSSPSDINTSNLTHTSNESPGSLKIKFIRRSNVYQSKLKNVRKQLNKDEFNNSFGNNYDRVLVPDISGGVNTNAINKNNVESTEYKSHNSVADSTIASDKPPGIIPNEGSVNQNTMLDSSNKMIGATAVSETKNITEDIEKNASEYSSITNFVDRPCDINSTSNVSNVDINKSMKDKNEDAANNEIYESALIIDESISMSGTINRAVENEFFTKSLDSTNEQTDNNTFGSTNNLKKLVTTLTRRDSKSQNSDHASALSTITYNHDADDGSNEPKNCMFQTDTTVADRKSDPEPSFNESNIKSFNIHDRHFKFSTKNRTRNDSLVAVNATSSIKGNNSTHEGMNESSIDNNKNKSIKPKTYPETFTVPDLITINSSVKTSPNRPPTNSVINMSDTNINNYNLNSPIKSKLLDCIDLDSNSSASNIKCEQLDAKEASSSGTIKKYPEIPLIKMTSSSINKPFTESGPSINDTNIYKCNVDSSPTKADKLVAVNVASSINGNNTIGEHTNEPSIDVSNSKTFPEIFTVPDLIISNSSAKISINRTPTDSITNMSDTNTKMHNLNSPIISKLSVCIDLDSSSSENNISSEQLDTKEASSSGPLKNHPEISLIPELPKSNIMTSSSINRLFTESSPSISDTNVNKCNVDSSPKKPDKLVAVNVASSINGSNTRAEYTNEQSIDVLNSNTHLELFTVPDLITNNSITKISTSRPLIDSVTNINDININMSNPNTPIKKKSLDFIELDSSNTITSSSISRPFNESDPSISDTSINKCTVDSSPKKLDKLEAINVASSINGSNTRSEHTNEPSIDMITETYPEIFIIPDLVTSNSVAKVSKTYTMLRNVSINDYDSLNSESIYPHDDSMPKNSTTGNEHLDINTNFSNSLTIITMDNAETPVNSNIIDDSVSKICISDPEHSTNSALRITSVKSLAPLTNLNNRLFFYQSDSQSFPTTNEEILQPVSNSSISRSEEFSSDQSFESNASTKILDGRKRKKIIPNQPPRKSSRNCKKSVPDSFIVPSVFGTRKLSRLCTPQIPKSPKTPNKASSSERSASPNKPSTSKQFAPPKKASPFNRRTPPNKTSSHNQRSLPNMSSQRGRLGRPKKVCASNRFHQFNEAGLSNKSSQSSQTVDKGLRKRTKVSEESDKKRKSSFESFCYCGGGEVLPMIACDNSDCESKWFHFTCVGIKIAPKGKWFCRHCTDKEKRRSLRDKRKTQIS